MADYSHAPVSETAIAHIAPQDILTRWPHVGPRKTQYRDTEHSDGDYLLYLGAGEAGIVKKIWFAINGDGTSWTDDIIGKKLRIWYDRGTIANPETYNETPDVEIDIGYFIQRRLWVDFVGPPDAALATRYWLAASCEEGLNAALEIRGLPIPYGNGCLIRYEHGESIYSWVEYESGAPPASWPYATWRLKTSNVEHVFAGGEPPYETATMLDVTGPGMLVGLLHAVTLGMSSMAVENNFEASVDDAGAFNWQTSGMEDLAGANPYVLAAAHCDLLAGSRNVTLGMVGAAEFYRLWDQTDPWVWSTSCKWRWGTGPEPGTMYTCMLYYAP